MRTRYMTLIKNQKGMSEYDVGVEESPNMETYSFSDDVFEKIYKTGVFNKMNQVSGAMISDYESEIIGAEHFQECLKVIIDCGVSDEFMILAFSDEDAVAVAFDF